MRQQQQQSQQLEELLDPPPRSPPEPVPPSPQRPETGEEGLPVYGPPNPAWLRSGAPASILAEPGRADGVVALACAMRTPVDPQTEIKGTIYGIEGIAPGFLRERRPWEDQNAAEEDEAGTSGSGDTGESGTWRTVDDDGRFPSVVDLFLRHGGRSRLSKSSSGASRRARRKRWKTGAPVGSAFGPPPIHQSLISLWMIGRWPKSGNISRSFASG